MNTNTPIVPEPENPVFRSVEEGDVRRVKSLIDRKMLATVKDSHGNYIKFL